MPWQEITFELDAIEVEAYEDALMAAGALSVTLRDARDQPLLEPAPETTPLWDKLLLTAMFDADTDISVILEQTKNFLSVSALPDITVNELQDREWRRTWMDHFKPMRFGQRLWICPTGYERPVQSDAVIIDLDPGLAFGTGSHPTTALCMQWLDAYPLSGKTVVDFGCGSGILAIAAAKLGAANVIATDNDPQALQATRDNIKANHVEDVVTVHSTGELPECQADILIANILFEPLLSLQKTFLRLLRDGALLIMSGILESQVPQLQDAYEKAFDFEACEHQEEWVRLQAVLRK